MSLLTLALPASAAGIGDSVLSVIAEIILSIVQLLGKLLLIVIGLLINIAQYNDFVNTPAVQTGWVIVRDVSNMFFIVVLLVIAFGTILRLEQYKYQRLLGKLILMAILINLSKFIAGFFIDAGQVVMLTFVNAFKDAAAGNFTTMFQLDNILKFRNTTTPPTGGEFLGGAVLALALVVVALVVMVILVVVLLTRIIMLWILIVLSPLAYILAVFPTAQKYSSQWWSAFWKQVVTGPVIAFFIWLALTVTVNTTPQVVRTVQNLPKDVDTQAVSGTAGDKSLAASVSQASTAPNILSFIIGIAMLVGALMVAQQAGGIAGGMAGNAIARLRKAGSAPLKLAASPFAAAKYGLGRGAAKIGRTLRESENLSFLTPDFWKGFSKRGERLTEESKTLAAGKGEFFSEKFFKGKKAAFDRAEAARRVVINTKMSEFNKDLGKAGESRQAMQDLARRAFYTGGHEGDISKQAFGELATGKGNLDDVYYAFGELYHKDKNFKTDVDEKFETLGFNPEEMFEKYSANNVRDFKMSFLGLDKKFLKKENAIAASAEDQHKLRAMASMSEAAKDVGHWEQYDTAKDAETGAYYIMDDEERVNEILGEAKKQPMRAFLNKLSPHVTRQRVWQEQRDENGNLTGKWDYSADNYAPEEGTFENTMYRKLLGGQHVAEMRQMQSRYSDQMVGKYFDENGNIVSTDEEAEKRGFHARDGKTAVEDLKADLMKLYESNPTSTKAFWSQKFLKKPDASPEKDRGNAYPWEEGYKEKVKPSEIDEHRRILDQEIHFSDVDNTLKQYGITDTRAPIKLRDDLASTELATRFGQKMIPRELVIARAQEMQRDKELKWDGERYKPGTEARGEEVDQEIEQLKDELSGNDLSPQEKSEREGKLKKLTEERDKIRGYWSEDTEGVANEISGILTNEAREDMRKVLDGTIASLTNAEGEKLGKDQQRELADKLMQLGPSAASMTPTSVPPDVERQRKTFETSQIRNLQKEHAAQMDAREAERAPEDRQTAEKASEEALGDLWRAVNERRRHLVEELGRTPLDEDRAPIQKEIDRLDSQLSSAQFQQNMPSRESISGISQGGAFLDINALSEKVREALETSTGTIDDFSKLAGEMEKSLGGLIGTLDKASKGMGDIDKKRTQGLNETLGEMRSNAATGASTGFSGNQVQQRELLLQLDRLNKVMKDQLTRGSTKGET